MQLGRFPAPVAAPLRRAPAARARNSFSGATSSPPAARTDLGHRCAAPAPATRRRERRVAAAAAAGADETDGSWSDANWLQTQLARAVGAEDYVAAARLKARLREVAGERPGVPADWFGLGLPNWLCDRAERLGFAAPTEVQRLVLPAACAQRDVLVRAGTGCGKTLAFLLPVLSNLDFTDRVFPQVIIAVPTRELGVQVVMLAWKLLGGNGDKANMFTFTGPRGVRVRGVFDDRDVARGAAWLDGISVVVGTPAALAAAIKAETLPLYSVEALVVDEMDECFSPAAGDCSALWDAHRTAPMRWQCIGVGASVTDASMAAARAHGLLLEPVEATFGGAVLPQSLRHRAVVMRDAAEDLRDAALLERRRLAVLVRLIRADADAQTAGMDAVPPRTIVFADGEAAARTAARPLRTALWGLHSLSVLLPGGEEPVMAMTSFRDGSATLLLATPGVERGLDMPDVAAVYCTTPPASATSYLHRAGRAGRVGSTVPGGARVTTLVARDQLEPLRAMVASLGGRLAVEEEPPLASLLGADAAGDADDVGDSEAPPLADLEGARRGLEDLLVLYGEEEETDAGADDQLGGSDDDAAPA